MRACAVPGSVIFAGNHALGITTFASSALDAVSVTERSKTKEKQIDRKDEKEAANS